MKRLTLLLLLTVSLLTTVSARMEPLTRGLVAIHKSSGGNFISWRLLGTDPAGTVFTLYRDGQPIVTDATLTSYTDKTGTANHVYKVVATAQGTVIDTSADAQPWADGYKTMKLDRPTDGGFSYYAQEASVADVDADGELEIVVKWSTSDAKDNSEDGITGSTILDCYRLKPATDSEAQAERLWRVNLGPNIRIGSHYTQFLFYDFNGDGRAEMICKTAPGSTDGTDQYVTAAATDAAITTADNTKDYRDARGRIMSGPEYLTVFEGTTGRALHTVWYNPNRGFSTGRTSGLADWGDDYANRAERFLACVAHLDGADRPASAVMCRGYYTRAYLWAVDFDGSRLSTRWLHASLTKSRVEVTDAAGQKTVTTYTRNTSGIGDRYTAYGQGCHSIAAGDVDGDGCDEIMYGGAAIDHDGTLLYSTGLDHGDAHHLADLMPDRPGLEFMMPHEHSPFGWHVRDAATGEILIHHTSDDDNGRGMAADIDLTRRGAEFWSDANTSVYDTADNVVSTGKRPSYCFRIYWDGTLQDNLLDGLAITSYSNGANTRLYTAPEGSIKNGSKAYPVLSADLFGDWREEVIWCSATDSCTLNICSTTAETSFRLPTLLHDHLYRLSVAWQNVGYNQPPHLSYYLPDVFASHFTPVKGITTVNPEPRTVNQYYDLQGRLVTTPRRGAVYIQRRGGRVVKAVY